MIDCPAIVIDGDTLNVCGERVRIAGIAAPDAHTSPACRKPPERRWRYTVCDDALARTATAYAKAWVARAGSVTGIVRLGCSHGRTVAHVRFGRGDFAAAVVAAGVARRVPVTWHRCA